MQEGHHAALDWRCQRIEQLSARELHRIHVARQQVFVVEQACVFQDADEADESSTHLTAWGEDGDVRAYARLVDAGVKYPEPSIGRVLTSHAARGTGLGRELLRRALAATKSAFPGSGVRLSAQARLERFYGELGFVTVGLPYLEDGMPHVEMLLPARANGEPAPRHALR